MKPAHQSINRRDFLKLLGLSGLSLFLTRCGLVKPAVQKPFATPPTTAPISSCKSLVATAKVETYDLAVLRRELARMFDDLGGLGALVKPGAKVGVKVNLTGGTYADASLPVPSGEIFTTHPAVVQALAELLFEAGAGKVTVMESLWDTTSYDAWGYTDMAHATGAELLDLGFPAPHPKFIPFEVGPDHHIFKAFLLNQSLGELDLFVSVAKMKCHATAGVTHSLKNLFGLAPLDLYRKAQDDVNRTSFHGTPDFDSRVPRVIIDLNRARPIHLSLIDGIMTAEGGEGPWNDSPAQVKPGVLVAGRDPVATDAVATAIMGFDPAATAGTQPFLRCDNHLALAAEAGLGTNRLEEIGVAGPSLQELLHPFKPAQSEQMSACNHYSSKL
jgi:uncharacterized protein (DUF362 family)